MKIRNRTKVRGFRLNMIPLMSVVILLVIFFLSTLRVSEPATDYLRSMPLAAAGTASVFEEEQPQLFVRLVAGAAGELSAVQLNGENLGDGELALERLNSRVFRAISSQPAVGPGQQEYSDIEIDPDYNLHYRYIISAIGACSGALGPNGVPVRYISRIEFAPRREQ